MANLICQRAHVSVDKSPSMIRSIKETPTGFIPVFAANSPLLAIRLFFVEPSLRHSRYAATEYNALRIPSVP